MKYKILIKFDTIVAINFEIRSRFDVQNQFLLKLLESWNNLNAIGFQKEKIVLTSGNRNQILDFGSEFYGLTLCLGLWEPDFKV